MNDGQNRPQPEPEPTDEEHGIIPLDEHRPHEEQQAEGREREERADQAARNDTQEQDWDEDDLDIEDDDFDEVEEDEGEDEPSAGELSDQELSSIVEALLFSTTEPLTPRKIAQLAGVRDARKIRALVADLDAQYEAQGRSFSVVQIARGYQLMTREELHPWVNRLHHREQEESLSQAALETLAIVTYRQPITRAQIEDIRGVGSGYILRSLIEKALVRVVGRSEELGRPLLYGTTDTFLEVFGLASLRALPKLEDLEAPRNG